jgi:signal transduction histidine kinase
MQENDKPANILIIDDTLANLQILVSMLDQHGYDVRPVNSGTLGLRTARIAQPDLILLDIQMPEIDGFEVCRRLKANEETRDIPVIFISALGETSDKVKAFQVGGVDYITKPFQLEEVLARVQTHLEIQRLRRLDRERIEEQARLIGELDAYAHTVAHDLKNPLSSIMGYAELLTSQIGANFSVEQQQSFAQIIVDGVERMAGIINALLLLASVRKQDEVVVDNLDMAAVVEESVARLDRLIKETKAEIIFPESWPAAMGFAPWVAEIWTNYISNAIKYGGRPPRIVLGADQPDEDTVRFWVQDNGRGLTPEEQAELFTPFTRLAETAGIQGHGLGLSIVLRITRRLAGTAGVESTPGEGSRFFFTLPAM